MCACIIPTSAYMYVCHALSLSPSLSHTHSRTHMQYFIFTTITNFGPLTCSIFTTTRKFFTILASVVIFGNALVTRQWAGVLLVFLGLGLDIFLGKGKTAAKSNGPASGTTTSSA